jgi:hypothetical protein
MHAETRAKDAKCLSGTADARSPDDAEVADAFSAAPRFSIEVCGRSHPRRSEAERFVQERFERTHEAKVRTFMPALLLYADPTGTLLGVAGMRTAADEPLFLERYLHMPVEDAIAARTGARVQRHAVVEIGNFACRTPHAATRFVSALPRFLLAQGHVWVTFTATRSVRRILKCLRARCADLGRAEGLYAGRAADDWGRYYDSDPRVMAGFLPLARRIPSLWVGLRGN